MEIEEGRSETTELVGMLLVPLLWYNWYNEDLDRYFIVYTERLDYMRYASHGSLWKCE